MVQRNVGTCISCRTRFVNIGNKPHPLLSNFLYWSTIKTTLISKENIIKHAFQNVFIPLHTYRLLYINCGSQEIIGHLIERYSD